MHGRRTIALLTESSRSYGRGLLRGIARYAHESAGWGLLHQEWDLDDDVPAWLRKGSCDGVIARIETPQQLRIIKGLKVPVIDLRRSRLLRGIPAIDTDDAAVTRLAAEHLLERGFRRIGYCGLAGVDYSISRRKQFVAYLRAFDIDPAIYEGSAAPRGTTTRQKESESMLHERELADWLRKLPKPIGIMACNDIRGRQVLTACHDQRIAVPGEVAVIGVDNDEVLCDLANPPLSSVIPATERIGYEAAALLQRMLDGGRPCENLRLIEPYGIATRRSTDVLPGVPDDKLAREVRRELYGNRGLVGRSRERERAVR